MALVQNFNVNPYYDDYDEDKKFLKMLFRPGYSVQARELTQLQSILQKQIERFGNHIFKSGSIVKGAEVRIESSFIYAKLQTTTVSGDPIDVNNFLGKSIGNAHAIASGGSIGRVVAVAEAEGSDPPTLFISYTTGLILRENETLFTVGDGTVFEARLINDPSAYGSCSAVQIDDGVVYVEGYFVNVAKQILILEKYTKDATYRIGLEYEESIVEETSDTSLLDPALNASNYQAPGSTRYKVELNLAKRSLSSTDDTKFFEFIRMDSGDTTFIRDKSLYSDILKYMAERTYDQSGNYTVAPFKIHLKDHVPYIGSNVSNTQLFTAKLSDGQAYIRGFSVGKQSTTTLDVARARDTESVQNYDINNRYGNYITVANTKGLFDVTEMSTYDLHIVPTHQISLANTITYNSTKVGTTRVREIEYDSAANTQIGTTYNHRLYVFDTRFDSYVNTIVSATQTTAVLPGNGYSSPVNDAYNGATIRISGGTGADNVKHTITDYVATTRTVTISDVFNIIPDGTSTFVIDYNTKHIESIAKINAATQLITSANVSPINKETNGDTYYSETNDKTLLFRIPQSFIKFGMTDQDFRGKYTFENIPVTAGIASFDTSLINGEGTLTNKVFVGSGTLSDSDKLEHFIVTANTVGPASTFTNGQIIPMVNQTGRSITIAPLTDAELNLNTGENFTVDIVATIDYNVTTPKTKTLVEAAATYVANTGGTVIGSTTVFYSEGQAAISVPNKVPGLSDKLYVSDVFKLAEKFEEYYGYFSVNVNGQSRRASFRVIDSGDINTAVTTADLSNDSKDITARYTLNDGQRDEYYDHGSITLIPGNPPPRGQILVLFNYFLHSGLGYFTLDSYNENTSLGLTEDLRYSKIPNYTSPATGKTYKLRDCVDFRPRRLDLSVASPNFTLTGIQIPKNGESLESDYSYYLPRTDRIVLRDDLQFSVIKGISSIDPQTPKEPENAMTLYILNVFPFTFFPNDTQVRFIENKRYTMKDIGKLEKRITNLEYYTTLNTLEKSAQDLTILDNNGLERFKNGILVDSFRGHQVGDVLNFDYNCSIDSQKGELRPSFVQRGYNFSVNTALSSAQTHSSVLVTPTYTVSEFISQNVSSKQLAVNPFSMTNYIGTAKFWPAGDFWVDTETRPDVLINLDGDNDAWERIGQALNDLRAPGFDQNWDPWQVYAGSSSSYSEYNTTTTTQGYIDYVDTVRSEYNVQYYSRERTGTQNTLVPERVYVDIGKRQVDLTVLPYIRAQFVIARASGLKPNMYHFLWARDGDTDATRYVEYPTITWLYNTTGIYDDSYGVFEEVTSSSGGTAKVVKTSVRSWSLETPHIFLVDMQGDWNLNDTITGTVSGATGKIDVAFWNNGNVISSTANTCTLGSGSPLNGAYVDTVSLYANTAFNSGAKVLEDNIHVNEFYRLRIISGKGIGQIRDIVAYNGVTKVATLDSDWSVLPDSTSRWSVGKLQSDDHGEIAGRWHLSNYGPTPYDNGYQITTGSKLIRFTSSASNNPLDADSMAEEYWYAQGVLNTVESVSVSVRSPTIVPRSIYESETDFTSTTSLVDQEIVGQVVVDRTPPPPPPPPVVVAPVPPPVSGPPPDTGGPYVPPPPPEAPASAGGSGCKIICAQMSDMGFFEEKVNEADQKFGRRLQRTHPKLYNGYVYWAKTIVDWNKGKGPNLYLWDMKDDGELQKNISLYMTKELARPWSQEMAKLEGVDTQTSILGKFIFWFGFLVSAIVGMFKPDITKPDSRLKGFTILSIMTFMFMTIRMMKLVAKPFEIFKKLTKKIIRK